MSPVDRQGGEARHPAGELGSKSREDFDKLVSRAAEARARGESHVPIAEGGEARPVRDRIKIGGLTQTVPVGWDSTGWRVVDVDDSRPDVRYLIWERADV